VVPDEATIGTMDEGEASVEDALRIEEPKFFFEVVEVAFALEERATRTFGQARCKQVEVVQGTTKGALEPRRTDATLGLPKQSFVSSQAYRCRMIKALSRSLEPMSVATNNLQALVGKTGT
jgi:hypothetical protein